MADEQLQAAVKPDVYLENGYLAFKNMEAVDSVIQMLGKMTTTEKESWENQIGLKSARSEFDKLFEEYDKLESYQDFLAFKKRNLDKLKFNETDPDDCSIDYPFVTRYFTPVLNINGVYKIGRTIMKYTMDDQIAILDGDINKLNNLKSFLKDDMVISLPKLKSGLVGFYNFPEDNPTTNDINPWHRKPGISDRKLKNELYYEQYIMFYESRWENGDWVDYYINGVKVYLNQHGQKVSWGKWRDYSTTYGVKLLRFKVDSYTECLDGGMYISGNANPSINFNLHNHYVLTPYQPTINLAPPTTVYFAAKVSFNGFGFNETDFYNIENPENYSYTGGYYIPIDGGWGW